MSACAHVCMVCCTRTKGGVFFCMHDLSVCLHAWRLHMDVHVCRSASFRHACVQHCVYVSACAACPGMEMFNAA